MLWLKKRLKKLGKAILLGLPDCLKTLDTQKPNYMSRAPPYYHGGAVDRH